MAMQQRPMSSARSSTCAPGQDFLGALLNKQLVAADVGLAFGGVQDQQLQAGAGAELHRGRERGAAEPHHAGGAHARAQVVATRLVVVRQGS
jgi:hypothetical protein